MSEFQDSKCAVCGNPIPVDSHFGDKCDECGYAELEEGDVAILDN